MSRLPPFFSRHGSSAAKARPWLETLESRDVPSYLAAEFPGYGVWLKQNGGAWQQLTTANATQVAADSNGDVVGQFPGYGVWLYSNGAWQQINAADSSGLAVAYRFEETLHDGTFINIYAAAELPGQGLWLYNDFTNVRGSGTTHTAGWQQLTPSNASAEAVDTNGRVVAEFPGYGVWLYGEGGGRNNWQQLTVSDATRLVSGTTLYGYSHVVAEFAGYGVWRFVDNAGWQQLTSADATAVAVNEHGDVTAEFAGYGVWSFHDSSAASAAGWDMGWRQLTPSDAALVGIDDNGNVYGSFLNAGVWFDLAGTWRSLTGSYASSIDVG